MEWSGMSSPEQPLNSEELSQDDLDFRQELINALGLDQLGDTDPEAAEHRRQRERAYIAEHSKEASGD